MAFVPVQDNVDHVLAVHMNEAYGATLTNKSGATRAVGDVVIQDTGNDSAFTTTVVEASPLVIGVVGESIANDASGIVQNRGPMAGVKVTGAVSRGDYLVTSTTAVRAKSCGTVWQTGVFALALTAAAGPGAGTVTAQLLPRGIDTTLELRIASGDPKIVFDIGGTDKYYIGVDDSDADKLVIGTGSAVGSNVAMYIHSNTKVGFGMVASAAQITVANTVRIDAGAGGQSILYFLADTDWRMVNKGNEADDPYVIRDHTTGTDVLRFETGIPHTALNIESTGDVCIGVLTPTTANGGRVLVFGDNTADPTMGANTGGIYGKDVGGTVEMFAIDEAGNQAQLTPHDSATGKWVFYTKNVRTGKVLKVHMERLMKTLNEYLGGGFVEEWTEDI